MTKTETVIRSIFGAAGIDTRPLARAVDIAAELLFTQTIGQAARNVHKRLRQVEYRTQSPDHPILWAADDSYYLKFYIFQVCDEK